MTNKLIHCVAVACLAAVLAVPASAQSAPHLVDGDLWLKSSSDVQRAFLIGAGNMIALETAYSQKKGTPMPAAAEMATRAVQGMTLSQIADRITRWYQANPTRRNTPVMGVIWIDMIRPAAAARATP